MSNLIFNLRIGLVHFQISRDRPWFRIGYNHFLRGKGCKFIELYQP